jgi:hypothetical protein
MPSHARMLAKCGPAQPIRRDARRPRQAALSVVVPADSDTSLGRPARAPQPVAPSADCCDRRRLPEYSADLVTVNRDVFAAHRAGQAPRALRGSPAGVL